MDNVTHSLTGLALSRAGLKRYCPHASLLLIIASNIPDTDMISMAWGRLTGFEIHRGYTHSLIGLPFIAWAPVLLTALIMRRRLPWIAAWLISCAGVAGHLILDWSMSYGIRFFIPFSPRWSYLDTYSLIDWILLAVLMLAWWGPALGKLVSDEIGAKGSGGRGLATFALIFLVAYGGFRGLMHGRVMSQLESRLYDEALKGPPTRMAAFPESLNPLGWHGIVESEHAYRMYDISAYGDFDPMGGELLYKTDWTPILQRVSETQAFRYCLYFSRFPYWQETPAASGEDSRVVTLTDLRFGRPGESFFTIQAVIDKAGQVKRIHFGSE